MSDIATIPLAVWETEEREDSLDDFATPSSADVWGPRIIALVLGCWAFGLGLGFQFAIAMLTAIGLTLAIGGLARPSLALLGLGLLCTLDSVMRNYLMTGGLLRWNTLNYWLVLFLLMALPTLMRIKEVPAFLLIGFIGVMVYGVGFTPDRRRGILDLLNIISSIGLLAYFMRACHDDRIWHWLGMVNGTLAAVGGFVFYSQKASLAKIDENGLSYFPLTALFSICIGFPFTDTLRGKATLSLLAAVNFLWVFLTGSRQGLLVGTVCLLFIISQLPGLGTRVVVLSSALLIGISLLSQFTALQDRTVRRVSKMFDSNYSMAARTSGRYDLMIGGWRIFREQPLGVGTGGFPYAWKHLVNRRGLSDFVKGREFNCHSAWIKALTENGLPGIVLLTSYVSSFVLIGWLRHSRATLKLGILATVVLSLAFIATEFQVKGTWFFASAMTVVLSRRHAGLVYL